MMMQPYRSPTVECPECGGEGKAIYEVKQYGGPPGAYSPFEEKELECQQCHGAGELEVSDEDDV